MSPRVSAAADALRREFGARAEFIAMDVGVKEQVLAAVEFTAEKIWGRSTCS